LDGVDSTDGQWRGVAADGRWRRRNGFSRDRHRAWSSRAALLGSARLDEAW